MLVSNRPISEQLNLRGNAPAKEDTQSLYQCALQRFTDSLDTHSKQLVKELSSIDPFVQKDTDLIGTRLEAIFQRVYRGSEKWDIATKVTDPLPLIATSKNGFVVQTRQLLGRGSSKQVYDGLKITVNPATKVVEKIERVAVEKITGEIDRAKEENDYAGHFSSSHLLKKSDTLFSISSSAYIMIREKYYGSLNDYLEDNKQLSKDEIVRIFKGATKGLAQIHNGGSQAQQDETQAAEGFIHRDIKPANIMVTKDGKGVIIDYGFLISRGAWQEHLLHTPLYTPPELVNPWFDRDEDYSPMNTYWLDNSQTEKGDLWAMGIALYQTMHPRRQTPYFLSGITTQEELHANLTKILLDSDGYKQQLFAGWVAKDEKEQALQNLIGKLLSVDPAERGTAEEAHRQLKELYKFNRFVPAPEDDEAEAAPTDERILLA